ncbi:ATP-grasp domain-containing protein [Streptomyces roseicoloratus]|uniref:ATP-grasp domain-containing protein n=1 Tax=Streptomyces roseicoloratus TaxID=2508722 RepID=A0ABY9RT14_9ACTN|nr:ATP-grasp domain-containing protein [Streptomyces roseicoloratus]WMX45333.1 ATP-grasp domain-containing protein [Streptomyces roseicoloratus]
MPSFDTRVPAVLVRLDPNPFHHGTLGAARSLGRAGIAVHAVVESPASPVVRSRYLRRAHQRPAEPSPAELTRLLHRIADEIDAETDDASGRSDDGPAEREARDDGRLIPLPDLRTDLRTGLRTDHRTDHRTDLRPDHHPDHHPERPDRPDRPQRPARQALLVPLDDITALALAECRPELADRFLLPDQSPEQLTRVADKAQLAETCRALALPHPRTELPASADEAAAMAWSLGLPVIAKWSRPWLLPVGGGLRSTTIVGSLAEVRELYARAPQAGSRLLLQELLPAGRGLDWFFHGYVDSAGGCSTGATGIKERSWPDGAGLTAVGRWTANPVVDATARELLSALGYRGVCDLDFRLDRTTGAYHLVDFNPRPGAQFRLFADRDGLDVVRAMHLDLTGRPVPAHHPSYGRRFFVENYAALSYLTAPGRRHTAGPPGTGGTRGREPGGGEAAWFAADDPRPALAMMRAWFAHVLRKGLLTLRRLTRLLARRLLRAGGPRPVATVPAPQPPPRTTDDRMTQR